MAVRTAKRGLAFGVVYGVAQDILRAAKGDEVAGWMRWCGVGGSELTTDTSWVEPMDGGGDGGGRGRGRSREDKVVT